MALGYKTGGRQKGTPNKNNPLRYYLKTHSTTYFEPNIKVDKFLAARLTPDDAEEKLTAEKLALRLGVNVGDMVSLFDIHIAMLSIADRVDAEIKLLGYSTPKLQTTSVDMTLNDDTARSIEERLADLAADNDTCSATETETKTETETETEAPE